MTVSDSFPLLLGVEFCIASVQGHKDSQRISVDQILQKINTQG